MELGLGQTTRIIWQYAEFNEECSHFVVEHSEDWIDFFKKDFSLGIRTKVVNLAGSSLDRVGNTNKNG